MKRFTKKSKLSLFIALAVLCLMGAALTESVKIYIKGNYRYIVSNGIPETHGQFPNAHNPNTISAQSYHFRVPLHPKLNASITPIVTQRMYEGVVVDGVPFDPSTDEYWNNDRSSGWHYTVMTPDSPNLGLDQNHAHVQPQGGYHYHGIPTGLYDRLSDNKTPPSEMILIGYAADGFPMYGLYVYKNARDSSSGLTQAKSSYRLKSGTRPSGPGGRYNGAFDEDFEYVAGLGDLDQCNGRTGVTPEYPQGTYYYVVTATYPFVSRCLHGTADQSFLKPRPSGPRRRRGLPPPPGSGFGGHTHPHGPPANGF